MSVLTEDLDVAAYAVAVRRSLVGLSQEQVDDLTDDLEADLADALADERRASHGRGLVEQFGTPEAYADELRAAAGLPTAGRPASRWERLFPDPVEQSQRVGRRMLAWLRRQAWWPSTESFLVALRPVWWVLRAWLVLQVATALVLGPQRMGLRVGELAEWVVLGGLVVASVQWGRGAWFQSRSTRWVPVLTNIVAVVAILPVLATMSSRAAQAEDVYRAWASGAFNGGTQTVYEDRPVDGVVVDGIQVSNLFVYDAQGNPLQDVQVYDDRGRPVRTTFDNGYDQFWFPESTEPWSFVPAADADGRSRWNVYPLRGAPTTQFEHDDDGAPVLQAGVSASTPPWPFAKAPALAGRGVAPLAPADGTVSASGEPSAGSVPTPTGAQPGSTSAPTP
ncbi:hypothetical protein [Cellulomonas sp.]|uniref:hypothetical protein n=1 Tax=Cellulomonas sp. TaxID=40001 RepID=UPI001B04B43A|nr:hypothetical protein [Cellulomonas sp.]MBO9553289.1 hypothetical protein [Cellulomonas sp.]